MHCGKILFAAMIFTVTSALEAANRNKIVVAVADEAGERQRTAPTPHGWLDGVRITWEAGDPRGCGFTAVPEGVTDKITVADGNG